MDPVPYQRATLSPEVPTRTEFTTVSTLETSRLVDFAVCNFTGNQTLDVLPSDWPDGSILTVELKDADSTVTFLDHEHSDADASSNIDFPEGVEIPTLSATEQYAQFRWDKEATALQGLWRYIGTNVPHLYDFNGDTDKKAFLQTYQNGVYQLVAQDDDGNAKVNIPLRLQEDGKTVLGGTSSQNADASYQHTMYGDVVIYDDTGTEATLTVQSTHTSGPDAATLRLIADFPTVSLKDENGAADQKTMQIGYSNSSLDFAFYPDSGVAYAVPLQLTTNGTTAGVILNALPTSDPTVAGQLWNDSGTLKVSAG